MTCPPTVMAKGLRSRAAVAVTSFSGTPGSVTSVSAFIRMFSAPPVVS